VPRGVPTGGRDELSRLLVALRGDRSQREVRETAARWLGGRVMSQSKIYRAESGQFPLTPEEADAFARACRASAADRRRLVELTRGATRPLEADRSAEPRQVARAHPAARADVEVDPVVAARHWVGMFAQLDEAPVRRGLILSRVADQYRGLS
jgi:hypothetical protein